MKKIFKAAFVVLAAICFGQQVKAQVSADSQPVTVNINLTDAISIDLGASPTVDFNYATAADYAAAKTVTKAAHFTVVSNQVYDIDVQVDGDFNPVLDLAALGLTVAVNSATPTGGSPANAILSAVNDPQPLITGAPASTGTVYTIDYTIPDASELITKAAGTYTTTVTYTATQQ